MSIKQGLLALLAEQSSYGYQLRADFEVRTANTWPLNIGQVYTTLSRLERDGLVHSDGSDDKGRQRWSITEAGRSELREWFATPVHRDGRPRDELAIKLALAATAPDTEVTTVVQAQRIDTLRLLQHYTRLKKSNTSEDLAWSLVLDGLIFAAEAEIRWLDHCESRVARHRLTPRAVIQADEQVIEEAKQ